MDYAYISVPSFRHVDILSIISKNISQNYIYKKHASTRVDYASFLVTTGADTRQWKQILHVPDIEDFVYETMERGSKSYQQWGFDDEKHEGLLVK